jgi:hypothetical protein
MSVVLGMILVVVGGVMLILGSRIARLGVSLRFSAEELRATSGSSRRRVRRATIIGTIGTMLVGAWFIYGGIQVLLG